MGAVPGGLRLPLSTLVDPPAGPAGDGHLQHPLVDHVDVVDRGERHPAGPDDDVERDVRGGGGGSGGDQMTARVEEEATPAGHSAAPSPRIAPPTPAAPLRSAAAIPGTSRKSLVLSVLVVLLGGLIAFAAARMLTTHTAVLAVARDVQVGSPITADDLAVANVTSDPH